MHLRERFLSLVLMQPNSFPLANIPIVCVLYACCAEHGRMAASSAVLSLAAAFGVPTSKNGVKDLVANFDFSKVTASSKSDEYLNIALAPAFGTLDSDSIKLMDDNLKARYKF